VRLAIEPTTRCPLDCIQCARAERIADERILDPAHFERLLDEMQPRRVHMHGCGEPLDHPELDRLCAAATRRGARVAVVSSLARESMVRIAERALDHIERLIVAVDGVDEATYSSIRRGAELRQVLDGLHTLRRLREQRGLLRPALLLTFLVQAKNRDQLPAFVRCAQRWGADAAIVLSLDLATIEERTTELVGDMRADELESLLTRARDTGRQIGMRTNLDLVLESFDVLRHRYWGEPLPRAPRCLRPWLSTYVTVDGEVRPCSRYAYDRDARLGNALETPFLDAIWNGEAYRRLRADLASGRPGYRSCPGCSVPLEEGGL
jgi:radical SAM protein with 4Fe4S-binding SPASM domain